MGKRQDTFQSRNIRTDTGARELCVDCISQRIVVLLTTANIHNNNNNSNSSSSSNSNNDNNSQKAPRQPVMRLIVLYCLLTSKDVTSRNLLGIVLVSQSNGTIKGTPFF